MKKFETLSKIKHQIMAIVRVDTENQALKGVEALIESGINVVELSFTTPYASVVLEKLIKEFSKNCLIGAGTILDSESARIAILSGAQYMVTPSLNTEVLLTANRYSIPVLPGVFTPTEVVTALSYGADVVKLFPASSFNFPYIKELKSPFPNLNVMPTGGINAQNIALWKNAGAFAYGVGGSLTSGFKNEDFTTVKDVAKTLISLIA